VFIASALTNLLVAGRTAFDLDDVVGVVASVVGGDIVL
jgi:hypothetical protein